jgi:hypothetical protein
MNTSMSLRVCFTAQVDFQEHLFVQRRPRDNGFKVFGTHFSIRCGSDRLVTSKDDRDHGFVWALTWCECAWFFRGELGLLLMVVTFKRTADAVCVFSGTVRIG